MKKLLIIGLLIACSISTVASARGNERWDDRHGRRDEYRDHGPSREKMRARDVLIETNDTLSRAQRAADRGGYRAGLGRAFAHQQEARDLYRRGRYERAIAHSMRARDIANDIIRVNQDRRFRRNHPHRDYNRHDDLDNSISVKIVDDNAAIKLRINLD